MKIAIYVFLVAFAVLLIYLGVFIALPPALATQNYCNQLKESTNPTDAIFIRSYIESKSEKKAKIEAKSRNLSYTGSWREMENRYDILRNETAQVIDMNPQRYVGEAMSIMLSKDYDETQKMFVSIMMQQLAIKDYLCLMDVANNGFERTLINKDVADAVISPDLNVFGTSVNYWWHPSWRSRFLKNADKLSIKDKTFSEYLKTWFNAPPRTPHVHPNGHSAHSVS